MSKNVLWFLLMCLGWGSLFAQQGPNVGDDIEVSDAKGLITGTVIQEENNQPLDFATVTVLALRDSSLITGGITDEEGKFSIEVDYGQYLIKVEFISFAEQWIPAVVISAQSRKVNVGTIMMAPSATMLDEVQVVAEKSEMQFDLDKRVFNVGKDLANKGGTAEDILDNIPSVTVDVEGNVALRGSENVRILVDGKPSGLVGIGDTDGLKSLPAGMIESIEVVTNASARYEASGTSGIINIVLKKDRKKGVNGSFDVNVGYPKRYGAAFNLNARQNKVNFFLNYGLQNREGPGRGFTNQTFYGEAAIPFSDQERTSLRGGISNSLRGGLDWFISDRDIITGAILYRVGNDFSNANTIFRDFNQSRQLTEISERVQEEVEEESNLEYELNYERKFTEKGRSLTAQFQYQSSNEVESADYTQNFLLPNGDPTGQLPLLQRSINDEGNGTYLLMADYVHPLSKDKKFEVGTRNSFRHIRNDYVVEELAEETWFKLPGLSNDFDYVENIYAVYGIFSNKIRNWSYQMGLRAEHSEVITELLQTNEVNDRTYTNLFPSAHINYEMENGDAWQLSYSRRISRPRFWYLNPFFSFANDRNIWGGNPNLDPEFTDSYELGYLKYWDRASLGSSIYYRHTTGVIERIARVTSEGITQTMPENLSTQDAFGFEFNGSVDISKWWRLDGNVNLFGQETFGTLGDIELSAQAFSMQTRMSSKIKFWKDAEFQTRFWYRAPENTTQGKRRSMYSLDLGFSKDLLEKKATITISVQDLLNTRIYRNEIFGDLFYMYSEYQRRAGQTVLSFNYRLNQKKQRGRPDRGDRDGGGDMEF